METISKRTAAEWIGGLWMKTAGQLRLRCFVETSFLAQATVELKRTVEAETWRQPKERRFYETSEVEREAERTWKLS